MNNIISFDYAIKYLLKSRGNYAIIEDFISAILESSGYPPVKIIAPLERESYREASDIKGSIADIAVQDAEGNNYLVEVDRSAVTHFVHKACFNVSRLIVDSLPVSTSYMKIQKVFHISVLYSPPKNLNSPLYHITSAITKINGTTREKIEIGDKNDKNLLSIDILPEYFIIAVPNFSGEVVTKLDDWLYFVKNRAVRPGCVNENIREALVRFSLLNMNAEERTKYFKFCAENEKFEDKFMTARNNGIEEGFDVGLEYGKIEGERLKQIEIAKKMLEKGSDFEFISACTGLSIEEIRSL